MKLRFTRFLLLGAEVLFCTKVAEAQEFRKKDYYSSVAISLNAMNYFGDVVPNPTLTSLRAGASRPNVGLSLTRRLAPRLSVRAALSYGRITGEDSKAADPGDADARFRHHRNINFRNDLVELSAVGVVDLFANRYAYTRRPNFVPYVFGGIALFHHNPKGRVEGGTVPGTLTKGDYLRLQPLRTEGQKEGYSLTQIALPFGVGGRYRLNQKMDLSLEIGWRKTFTDYLDDVSGDYTAIANLDNDAARYFGHSVTRTDGGNGFYNFNGAGSMRGSSNEKDWYIVTGFSLNYILVPNKAGAKFR